MRPTAGWFTTLLLTAGLLGGALALQGNMIKEFYKNPETYRDWLYVPSQGYLQAITLGYQEFAADYFWLRMIQTYASGWSRSENASQMQSYFNGISDLAPDFLDVYRFSILALGDDARRGDLVRVIVNKAVVRSPGNWLIPYDGAAYFGVEAERDLDQAKLFLALTLDTPKRPRYIENWAGYFEFKDGRFLASFEKYMMDSIQALGRGDDELADFRMIHLERAVDGWFKHEILAKADAWQKEKGTFPTVAQLDEAGAFKGVRLPDWGATTSLLDQLRMAGKTDVSDENAIREVVQRLIRTWDRLPPVAPLDARHPEHPGYFVVESPGQEETVRILTYSEIMTHYRDAMQYYQSRLAGYKEAHDGKCPEDPRELTDNIKGWKDPLGGEFKVDPETCIFTITSAPELVAIPSE